jgi:hypothetical protein
VSRQLAKARNLLSNPAAYTNDKSYSSLSPQIKHETGYLGAKGQKKRDFVGSEQPLNSLNREKYGSESGRVFFKSLAMLRVALINSQQLPYIPGAVPPHSNSCFNPDPTPTHAGYIWAIQGPQGTHE